MRIACIIMAHKEPLQIERFIKKFSRWPVDFYIHLDKKVNPEPFHFLAALPKVHFIRKRIPVRWASYNFVRAEFQSFREILDTGIPYDFISLMSGQDYLIKPVTEFLKILETNPGKNFISYDEGGLWWTHAVTRINKYHFNNFGFRGRYRLQSLLNALTPKREFPLPYQLYGGPRAMCMTLSYDCVRYLVEFVAANHQLRRFMQYTWGADEFLIPTLIMNSVFRESVVNDNFYFIDWSEGGANPKILRTEDFNMIRSSGKIIARKFDLQVDEEIMNQIDRLTETGW